MNIDRILTVLGILVSALGVLISIKAHLLGAIAFIVGLSVFFIALWRIKHRDPIQSISRATDYVFKDPKGLIVKVTRIGVYKINSPGVTTLWVRSIEAMGELKNFVSNIGSISINEASGGGIRVRCDLDRPAKPGSKITWILKYDGHNCFEKPTESVSFTTTTKLKRGVMSIEFHQDRFPPLVEKVLYLGEGEELLEEISLTKTLPNIRWEFNPIIGRKYLLKWTWPDYKAQQGVGH